MGRVSLMLMLGQSVSLLLGCYIPYSHRLVTLPKAKQSKAKQASGRPLLVLVSPQPAPGPFFPPFHPYRTM
ncbi:hypothetical protein LX36DRAFT_659348 [Colletotrichum falcatum]|nr:hypothetical protein LX36DRAFT_659348 [Colletotrichum falcatum]